MVFKIKCFFSFIIFVIWMFFFLLSPSSLLSLLCANGEIEENCLITETKNRIFTCKMNKLISFTFKMRLFIFSSIVYEYGALWSYDQRKRILDFTLNKGNHSELCNAFFFDSMKCLSHIWIRFRIVVTEHEKKIFFQDLRMNSVIYVNWKLIHGAWVR